MLRQVHDGKPVLLKLAFVLCFCAVGLTVLLRFGCGVRWQSFKSKKLDDTESKCVTNCAEKFMRLTQRVGFRVAEHQQGTASP